MIVMQKHPASFFFFFQNIQKVSATYNECNVAKQCAEALEWRLKTRQKSICAERPKGVRHLISALGFFDAFSAGNGSASAFRLMLAKFHLELHLPSTCGTRNVDFFNISR